MASLSYKQFYAPTEFFLLPSRSRSRPVPVPVPISLDYRPATQPPSSPVPSFCACNVNAMSIRISLKLTANCLPHPSFSPRFSSPSPPSCVSSSLPSANTQPLPRRTVHSAQCPGGSRNWHSQRTARVSSATRTAADIFLSLHLGSEVIPLPYAQCVLCSCCWAGLTAATNKGPSCMNHSPRYVLQPCHPSQPASHISPKPIGCRTGKGAG